MAERVAALWAAVPTMPGLAVLLMVVLATAGWAATWNTRAGTAFALLNVGIAAFIVAALVGWLAAGR